MRNLLATALFLTVTLVNPSYAFTGPWYVDAHRSDTVEKAIHRDFRYLNEKNIRFVGRYSGGVRTIGTRYRKLKPHQIAIVRKVLEVVPMEPITKIEETDAGVALTYADGYRREVGPNAAPAQSYAAPVSVIMLEQGTNWFVIETIHSSGVTVMETFELTETRHGELRLGVTIVARTPKFPVPLVVKRYYTGYENKHIAEKRP